MINRSKLFTDLVNLLHSYRYFQYTNYNGLLFLDKNLTHTEVIEKVKDHYRQLGIERRVGNYEFRNIVDWEVTAVFDRGIGYLNRYMISFERYVKEKLKQDCANLNLGKKGYSNYYRWIQKQKEIIWDQQNV